MNARHWISLSLIVPIGLALGAASSRFVDPVMKNRVEEPYQRDGNGQPSLQYEAYHPREPQSYPLDTTHPGAMAAWVPPPVDYYTADNDDWAYVPPLDSYPDTFGPQVQDPGLTDEARQAGDAARQVADATLAQPAAALPAEPRTADGELPAIW